MKNFKRLTAAMMAAMLCLSFAACSSEDENEGRNGIVNPSNVFTEKSPKEISDMKITYDKDGLVSKIEREGEIATFEYPVTTRATQTKQYVKMTVTVDTGRESAETFIFDMEIGDNGFVKHCTEKEEDGEIETWQFKYTAEGNLNYMKRSEGGNEVTTITYKDGNIIKSFTISEEEPEEASDYEIAYTSDKVKTPIENKGCLMLFDATLGIDLDEMEFAYYAGMLGKSTKHLPVKLIYKDDKFEYTNTFAWTMNTDNYPTKLFITNDEYSSDNEIITFVW